MNDKIKSALARVTAPFRPPTKAEVSVAMDSNPPFVPRDRRILLLEDDPNICYMLNQFFAKWRVSFTCAHSIAEATRIVLNGDAFDLFILDVRLANGSGLDFYARVNSLSPGANVVFCTGFDSEELRKRVEAIGPARVYNKTRFLDFTFLTPLLKQMGFMPNNPAEAVT